MKTKTPFIIAGVITLGAFLTLNGTWLPQVDSQQTYGYSPETYTWQESYDYNVSAVETTARTLNSAYQAYQDALKAASAAKQSLCAAQIGLGNSKLKDVGDKDPAETTRLIASVAEGAKCLLLESPAFTQ